MHVLLTNDDGPPSDLSSPYIQYFVEAIRKYTDWDLSIALPHTQRSWIGKAHMIGQNVTASYIYPKAIGEPYDGPFDQPRNDGSEEWVLLDGTPASCANIGIHQLFQQKGPVDLVLSGPNYGRNSTALYIMSSGTVGAAMEGALCGVKSIGVSFAFETRIHVAENIRQASRISVKLIDYLCKNWSPKVHLYSINVPLIDGIGDDTKIQYAHILDNRWGPAFETVADRKLKLAQAELDANHTTDQLPPRDSEDDSVGYTDVPLKGNHTQFLWNPDFHSVRESVRLGGTGNDGWVVDQGWISVTPLRATFKDVDIKGEIKLNNNPSSICLLTISSDSYVYPLIENEMKRLGVDIRRSLSKKHIEHNRAEVDGATVNAEQSVVRSNSKPQRVFQYGEYEDLDFDRMMSDSNYLACSYIYRKALIRKHFLANTIEVFTAKNPSSILTKAFPRTFHLELDYAEFLDDALDETFELRQELQSGEKTWILKPSMSDKGQGIRLFKTIEGLQKIFEDFEGDEDEDEVDGGEDVEAIDKSANSFETDQASHDVITSQLRHFIVQEYVSPLLISHYDNRKFHIRTYVTAVGTIQVFVYNEMLALFAAESYQGTEENEYHEIDMKGHLTNTCLQTEKVKGEQLDIEGNTDSVLVKRVSDLEGISSAHKDVISQQIYDCCRDLFLAAIGSGSQFQPLPNAFEIYGVDFLVDESFGVHVLEVNAYPDFKQTGSELKGVIQGLFKGVINRAVKPFFGMKKDDEDGMVLVLDQKIQGW